MAEEKEEMEFDIEDSTYFKLTDKVLANMRKQASNVTSTSIMLGGDPGIGKTSFIRTLSKLLGMHLIVIEVPHIVEEHIINVPFIIFDPVTDKKDTQATSVKMEDDEKSGGRFDIELADSNLASQIKVKKPIPDNKYLSFIQNQPENIKEMYRAFGGTDTEIPEEIQEARENYHVILFIDEFFRMTSTRIRNMLRTILNGKIGLDDMPAGAYTVYASNLNDEGLEDLPMNTDFVTIDMEQPTFEEWISYLAGKYGIEDDIPKKKKDDNPEASQDDQQEEPAPVKRGRGRPKGSTNKKKA